MGTTSGYNLESLSRFLQEASRRCSQPESPAPDEQTEVAASAPATGAGLAALDAAWERARQAFAEGTVLQGVVTGWNRGGLLVRWDDLQGFVPASQLREVPLTEDPEGREQELCRWIGENLRLKVIELDRGRNRLVFSERATIWGPKDGDRVLEQVRAGEVRHGQVSNICDFGAFVDLGGVDGLIHLSELSWGRVAHPRDILDIGDEVDVYVISVDREHRRIALSLKRLRPDPWTVVEQRYRPGQVVEATISNVVAFGAFAQIEEGLEGLIHISELSDTKVAHPGEVVQTGDRVTVRILRVDSVSHRLGLSMRLAQEQGAAVVPGELSSGAQEGADSDS